MDKKILREENIVLRNGRIAPLRIVELSNREFETSLDMVGITLSSRFKQEERAIAFYDYLKARFMKK